MKKKILISTGGSGGHVIPATIFYDHLQNNFDTYISTDKRGTKYLNSSKYKAEIIDTPKLNDNLFLLPWKLIIILYLTIKSLFFLKKKKIDILISTGGYMSSPLCLAAKILAIKIYLFEPNIVLGRANIFFLKFSKKIFCYYPTIVNFPKKYNNKIVLINNLLRKEFYEIRVNENKKIEQKINLLIIGGSQGAKLFDTKIKDTIMALSNRYELNIIQQTGDKNYNVLKKFYDKNNIKNKLFNFDEDILKFITSANLCITRAGASTLSELTFLNIPFLAIPYQLAKDDHQFKNASFYKDKDCCWLLSEKELQSGILTTNVIDIIENKDDYLIKKRSMKNFSYQNTWNKINQKLIETINEN